MIQLSFPFGPPSLVVSDVASDHPQVGSLMARMPELDEAAPPDDPPPDEAWVVVAAGGGAAEVLGDLGSEETILERHEERDGRKSKVGSKVKGRGVSVRRSVSAGDRRRDEERATFPPLLPSRPGSRSRALLFSCPSALMERKGSSTHFVLVDVVGTAIRIASVVGATQAASLVVVGATHSALDDVVGAGAGAALLDATT